MIFRVFFLAIALVSANALFVNTAMAGDQLTNLVKNSSFDSGAQYWENVDGIDYKVGRGFGYNGNSGLRCNKAKGARYVIISQELSPLKPGVPYAYGAMVRCDNTTHPGVGICIEVFTQDGQWLFGGYSEKLKETQDWKMLERVFSTELAPKPLPPNCRFRMELVIDKRSVGTAYFDDVFVKEIREEWFLSQVYPTHNSITVNNGNISFFSELNNTQENPENLFLKLEIKQDKKLMTEKKCRIKNNLADVDLGNLPAGNFTLKVSLVSEKSQRIIGSRKLPLTVKNRAGSTPSSCYFDIKGRAVVNGKLFMPIGLFTQKLTESDFDRFKKADFNCIMPYAIINRNCKNFEDIQKYFDNAKRTDIKIIPSLINYAPGRHDDKILVWNNISGRRNVAKALIERYKNNPYLLAWYINDEVPVSLLRQTTAYREFINQLDPNHPTWAVICRKNEIQPMSASTDVMGVDSYPIINADSTLVKEDNFGVKAEALGMPFWAVPQIFDWAVFRPSFNHYEPTYRQMLSICLLQAIHGAKGFIMFSHCSLFRKTAGPFERRWPDICKVAKELKQLEPFIMSDTNNIPLKIKQIKGLTRARCFSDGKGNYRLLAVGVDQQNEAEIILFSKLNNLNSQTNTVVNMKNGTYKFIGGVCSYDILSNHK